MFVAWQRKPLSESGAEHYACSHALEGPGRGTIKPVVRHAFRLDGKPRNQVIARPSCAIRLCCLNDAADPIARGSFWACARHRAKEAAANLGIGACGMKPLEVELWRYRSGWLFAELAKVVPELTPDEQRLCDLFGRPEGHFLRGVEASGRHVDRLEASRQRVAAYLRGRRQGETAHAWWCRVEPPAQRVRVSAEGFFGGAFGASGAPPGLGASGRPSPGALEALGLAWPCSADEAKRAYQRAALRAHPDQGGTAEALRRVTAARAEVTAALSAGQA